MSTKLNIKLKLLEFQGLSLQKQLELAREVAKPAIIHSRGAAREVIDILRQEGGTRVALETNGTISGAVIDMLHEHRLGQLTVSPKPLFDEDGLEHVVELSGRAVKPSHGTNLYPTPCTVMRCRGSPGVSSSFALSDRT